MRDYRKISSTAFNHIIFRTFYDIPYAVEFFEAVKNLGLMGNVFKEGMLRENSPIFEARYRGGEGALEEFIKRNPHCVVLELAAGFSLHGVALAKKYPKIRYIETDLPNIIKVKERIIKKTGLNFPNLAFKSANALDLAALKKPLVFPKPESKIAIYCEGLLSYFGGEEMTKISEIIKKLLLEYGGAWITPDPAFGSETRKALMAALPHYEKTMKKAQKLAGQNYNDNGFLGEKETDKFFKDRGYLICKYPWRAKLHSFQTSGLEAEVISQAKRVFKQYGKTWILTSRVEGEDRQKA